MILPLTPTARVSWQRLPLNGKAVSKTPPKLSAEQLPHAVMARISDVVFALVPSHGTVEVREARMSGLRIFGVTVDEDAGDWVASVNVVEIGV
ncbi:MAG TPA: hypothetical protein ENH55_19945 [Aurantimonas coralicida]|nr:hypothetical protein [Aurantimonas coralicida]